MEPTRVIRKPVLTEKALHDAAAGEYTFEVDPSANKAEIAQAVAQLLKVDVRRVKTRIIKNKTKRILRSRRKTTLSAVKKATVKVGKEQKIDIFEVKS